MKLLKIVLNLFYKIIKKDLEESMRGSEFAFDRIDLLYYHLQKTSLKKGGSNVNSSEWLKNKRATTNPKNNYNNCFQYVLTIAFNYLNIKKDPQRISRIKPFIIDQYNWKEIDFPSKQKDWKNFELNNKTIALNILFVPYNTEKIRLTNQNIILRVKIK